MALADVFGSPLGLAAAAGVVPLIVLYLIQPDPRRLTLPTTQFLADDPDEGGANPVVQMLRRNLLLLLQLLVVLLFAVSLASPYVTLTQETSNQPTVVVVDASASMATDTGDGTRFANAIDAANGAVGDPTTVVVAGANTRVAVEDATPQRARQVLGGLRVTDAQGDLRSAISRAGSLAPADGRVVVLSDFAGEGVQAGTDVTAWRTAVQTIRASGPDVELQQFDGGGADNVGIVGRQFSGQQVSFSVKNTGDAAAERTVEFAGESRSVTLRPGDVSTVSFPLPAEPSTAQLSPGDSFPTDDAAYVSVPDQQSVDVLLLANGEERGLRTALEVIPTVDVTVQRPPTAIDDTYDVIVIGDVQADRILQSTVTTIQDHVDSGGGLAVRAQDDLGATGLGSTVPVTLGTYRNGTRIETVAEDRLTRGFDFPTPDRHLEATQNRGRTLVETTDGSPLLSTATSGEARVLYTGYLPEQTAFAFSYRYPVFWKRASDWLAGRPPLSSLNRQTGSTLQLGGETTVETPVGSQRASALLLTTAGTYSTDSQTVSASLLDASETNVTAPPVETSDGPTGTNATLGAYPVEQDLTPLAAALVLLFVFGELAFLRHRGDL